MARSIKKVIAVDPSLTCSGWALFSVERDRLLAVGKIKSLGPNIALAERLRDLQEKIASLIVSLELGEEDALVCESPTTMRDPGAAFKVEQVRGIFETIARSHSILVPGRINPRSVHQEVLGLRGQQLGRQIVKDTAVHAVKALFSQALEDMGFSCGDDSLSKHQDIVDAILLGSLAVTRLRSAIIGGLPAEHLFESRAHAQRQSFRSASAFKAR
ncbi:MAG: hypothetical protein DCC75_04315 [Proteobacteria bacterium]|nr:MAG: hypothetical protein DCC75_04315 [Pseudomonadota bacterium]